MRDVHSQTDRIGAEESRDLAIARSLDHVRAALPQALFPPMGVNLHEQGALRDRIVQDCQRLRMAGWGADGTVTGTKERVRYERLWIHPLNCISYSQEELVDCALSLKTRGQLEPLLVAKARDTRSEDEGGTGGDLLIIDGKKRYLAAPLKGLDRHGMEVIVTDYKGFYESSLDLVTTKLTQHTLTAYEMGRLILRLRIAYEVERADLQARGALEHDLPFPTQEELAAMLGRSQSRISTWIRLASQPDELIGLVDTQQLTTAQAEELLALPSVEERLLLAAEIAEENAVAARQASAPVKRETVRNRVRARLDGPQQWVDDDRVQQAAVPNHELWLPQVTSEDIEQLPLPVCTGYLIHDTLRCLEEIVRSLDQPDPALLSAIRALKQEKIQAFVGQLAGDFIGTTVDSFIPATEGRRR